VHFGLGDKNDLPGVEELKAAGLIGPRPDIVLSEAAAMPPAEEAADDDDADDSEDEAEHAEAAEELEEAETVAEETDEPATPER
jgi:segregation and condensation protein B